jgi:hypothetical protein
MIEKSIVELKIRITKAQKLWLAEKAAQEGSTCTAIVRDLIKGAILKDVDP